MRSFEPGRMDPVPGDVVARLRRLDRAAGAESSFADQLPQLLDALRRQARVESVTASNAIEGVVVDEVRVPRLLDPGARRFRDRSEEEFAGYRAALDYLHQEDVGALSVGLVLHLHRLVFSFSDGGGSFKTVDNLVVDLDGDGVRRIRFQPVSAVETPFYVEEAIARTDRALERGRDHPLIVVAAFVLDLLCIHPFADGNGRVARLLTSYLLERCGYHVGRYVSLEQLVYDHKDGYYASLAASTAGWFDRDGQHEVWPWVRFLLDRLDDAYSRFEARIAAGRSGATKQDRVRDYVLLHAPSPFAIADVRRAVPGVSDNTIRLVLAALRREGLIAPDGTGRSATWRRVPR